MEELHSRYMQRCLELAQLGMGNVAPNPLVGAVIVYQNKIIGEGYHQECGKAHAEVNAINSVKDQQLLKDSTLYVNLEPCAHYGKTPPCANLIVKKEIPQVVISNQDPFELVAGKGIELLQQAGIKVTTGVLEKEGEWVNRRFFTTVKKQRPYIILKWAQTLDGKLGSEKQRYLTDDVSNVLVHKWRSEEASILVGANTVNQDNPSLTTRLFAGKNPVRIVLDATGQTNSTSKIYDSAATTILVSDSAPNTYNCQYLRINPHQLSDVLAALWKEHKLQSIIVEGGRKVLDSFIDEGLWDEARVLVSPHYFGNGLDAPVLKQSPNTTDKLSNDTLLTFLHG